MRRIAAVALAATAVLAGGSAHAQSVESKAYIGVVGDQTVVCPASLGLPDAIGVGGNCFTLSQTSRVSVLIDDIVSSNTAFKVGFYGPTGRIGDLHPACGDYTASVPATASLMRVFVGTDTACPGGATGGLGTAGWLSVVKTPAVTQVP